MISNEEAKATRPDGKNLFLLTRWYRDVYRATIHWEERRQLALEHGGFICESCGSTGILQIHHLSYAHLFNEPNSDLMVLCNPCHKVCHGVEFEHQTRGMPPDEKRKATLKQCAKSHHIPKMTFRPPNLGKRWRK